MKVVSIPNNHCIRVLIPDENVGHGGFHDVLLHDMAEADSPYVATSDLMALRLDWPGWFCREWSRISWSWNRCVMSVKNDYVMPRLGCAQPVEK